MHGLGSLLHLSLAVARRWVWACAWKTVLELRQQHLEMERALEEIWESGFLCPKGSLVASYSLWFQCWETQVGQEMYKLMIFDLIIILAVTLFVDFPRK